MASVGKVAVLVLGLFGAGFGAISPFLQDGGAKDNSITTPAPWAPATQPREFSYHIQDGILGANQVRHEVWKNGTMSGMYAYPLGNNQWQVVDYIADGKGFRVTNTKAVSEQELMDGHKPASQQADVDIDRDGLKTSYSVKASEINQKAKQQKQKQQSGAQDQEQSP